MDKLFSPASYADKKGLVFAYELHRARWQKCGDPRDHIFALLGHPAAVDPVTGKRWVEADYTKRVEEVYHETAMQLLANGNGLMVLNVVQHESLDKGKYGPFTRFVCIRDLCETQPTDLDRTYSATTRRSLMGTAMG